MRATEMLAVHAEDSVGAKLIDEIERVSALRERCRQTARLCPQANVRPAIALMTASIDLAKRAILDEDGVGAIRCLDDLAGYA